MNEKTRQETSTDGFRESEPDIKEPPSPPVGPEVLPDSEEIYDATIHEIRRKNPGESRARLLVNKINSIFNKETS